MKNLQERINERAEKKINARIKKLRDKIILDQTWHIISTNISLMISVRKIRLKPYGFYFGQQTANSGKALRIG